jgi:phosphomannomutase
LVKLKPPKLVGNADNGIDGHLVRDCETAYPYSGSINYQVADTKSALGKVEAHFATLNPSVDRTDGLGLEFSNWCLNLRSSNTEPLLHLNVESWADACLVAAGAREIETVIGVCH